MNFKFSFSLEKYIQSFFDKISETISSYKILKRDEKRRIRIETIEREREAKIELAKQKEEEACWQRQGAVREAHSDVVGQAKLCTQV